MPINDQAITRISSLEISGSDTVNNGFYTPQLTQAEINAIPPSEVQIGGIVYNSDTQELQYFSPALQWVNITSDEGEPTFTDLTVTGNTTLNTLTTTGNTTIQNLTVNTSVSTPRIVINGDPANTNLTVNGKSDFYDPVTFASDVNAYFGTIYGKRPSAYLYNKLVPSFTLPNTFTKIPGTTISTLLNQFIMSANNRLQYTSSVLTPINVSIYGSYSGFINNPGLNVGLGIAINGVPIEPLIATTTSTTNGAFFFSLNNFCSINNGDYIELWAVTYAGSSIVQNPSQMILSVTEI
jgi:hypothetical protein